MSKIQDISPFCIYTMLHKQKLDEIFVNGGAGEATEKKLWKQGQRLLLEEQKDESDMLVFFSAADIASGLIYFAFLKSVEVDEELTRTKYKFSELTKLEESLPLSSLKLKSTGEPLSDSYIRPYAICYTPSFIEEKL